MSSCPRSTNRWTPVSTSQSRTVRSVPGGGQDRSLGAERDVPYVPLVAGERSQLLPRVGIPDLRQAGVGEGDPPSAGIEGHPTGYNRDLGHRLTFSQIFTRGAGPLGRSSVGRPAVANSRPSGLNSTSATPTASDRTATSWPDRS